MGESEKPLAYIHDHSKYLKKSSRRRTFFGQSIRATTFFASVGTALLGMPFAYLLWKVFGVLPVPTAIVAIFVLFPIVVPVMIVIALLESRNEGDTFLSFLKKKWIFKTRTNFKTENGEKFMYAIGMSPKTRIIKGETLFMTSVVEIPSNISNLSGFVDGSPVDETKTVNSGIVITRRD